MLNAISGNDTDDRNQSLTSALQAFQNVSGTGTGSISDISTLLGGYSDAGSSIGSLDSFSSILQSYLNTDAASITTDTMNVVQYMDEVEQVLEETAGTEKDTRSYQTLQDIYQYFADTTAGKASSLQKTLETSESDTDSFGQQGADNTAGSMFDFDSIEDETDAMIDALFEE